MSQLVQANQNAGRDLQVPEIRSDAGIRDHALAVDCYPPPHPGGDVQDLLDPVDVAGKTRNDDPPLDRSEDFVQGSTHRPFGGGEPWPQSISRVGEQHQDAPISQLGELVIVGELPIHRSRIKFEIPRVNDKARRRFQGHADPVGDAVADPHAFHLENPHAESFPGDDLPQVSLDILFPDLFSREPQGERGSVDGDRKFLEQEGKGASMVFVAVGENKPANLLTVLEKIIEIGDHQINP